jgi:hypothetical protein
MAGDELACRRARLVGVDLVADHQRHVGPAIGAGFDQGGGAGRQRIDAFRAGRPVEVPWRDLGDPAGTEGEPGRPVRAEGAQHAWREATAWNGPADRPVQRDLVLVRAARREAVEHDEAVVVPGHLEGPGGTAEYLHLAFPVGLDPERRFGLADVAQHRPEC